MMFLSIPQGSVPEVFFFLPLGGTVLAEAVVIFLVAVTTVTLDDLRRLRRP